MKIGDTILIINTNTKGFVCDNSIYANGVCIKSSKRIIRMLNTSCIHSKIVMVEKYFI